MKALIALSLIFASAPAFALDSLCVTKQKNAAIFALAQELVVPVGGVEVVEFRNGMWTEAAFNNTGTDLVVVSAGNRINRGITTKIIDVTAKQIGNSEDCNIVSVQMNRR